MKKPTRPWTTDLDSNVYIAQKSVNVNLFDKLVPWFPKEDSWLHKLGPILQASALGLIADIHIELAKSKRDLPSSHTNRKSKSGKPIFTFWDEEIPKPNKLTCLMWLLTCEAWPLPSIDSINKSQRPDFPPTAFVMPQSPSRQSWNRRPASHHADSLPLNPNEFIDEPLEALMMHTMTTRDRANMIKFDDLQTSTRVHLPQTRHYINIGALEHALINSTSSTRWNPIWQDAAGWPRAGQYDLVEGFAYEIPPNSQHRLDYLWDLRHRVFLVGGVLSQPGIPTCVENLHKTAGSWIRHWSRQGLCVAANRRLSWNLNEDPLLWAEKRTEMIPAFSPRIYFGWTEFGPRFEVTPEGKPVRIETPSEEWAQAYLFHRPQALRMLFEPESINIESIIEEHTTKRSSVLENAGRLGKKKASTVEAIASAFQGALQGFGLPTANTKDKGE